MKGITRVHALFLVLVLCVGLFSACSSEPAPPVPVAPVWKGSPIGDMAAQSTPAPVSQSASLGVINLWSFTDEVPLMVEKYKEFNPDFNYDVNVTIIPTTDGEYQPALDLALAAGGEEAPDVFTAEAAFVIKYTQGDMAHYAAPYADLGIDVAGGLKAAQIATYASDIGTRGDGRVGRSALSGDGRRVHISALHSQ